MAMMLVPHFGVCGGDEWPGGAGQQLQFRNHPLHITESAHEVKTLRVL